MTAVSEDKVLAFLAVVSGGGSGYGSGRGSSGGSGYSSDYGWEYGWGYGGGGGDGSGDCSCCGSGDGLGVARGDGSCYGSGDGSGDGSDIKSFSGAAVHMIDGVPTILTAIHRNTAKGYILRDDLTLDPCYIAKAGNCFAHGDTLEKAVADARDKLFDDMPEDERIAAFMEAHERGVKYPARDFYDWHHRLTGSCRMGRDEFVRAHGIDLENGMYTVEEFVAITRNSYGGAVIARLEEGT